MPYYEVRNSRPNIIENIKHSLTLANEILLLWWLQAPVRFYS